MGEFLETFRARWSQSQLAEDRTDKQAKLLRGLVARWLEGKHDDECEAAAKLVLEIQQ